ncbi:MAG: S1 RNA-binding domain-containing protein [Pirellulaceae bacterium]
MSTNQDESRNPSASTPADQAAESTQPTEAETETQAASPRKILIGSQRDAANPELKHQTLRFASVSPEQVGSAIQKEAAGDSQESQPAVATAETIEPPETHAAPTPVAESPLVESPVVEASVAEASVAEAVELPTASDDDDELQAALDDLEMDSLLGDVQPADELELESRIKGVVTRVHNDNVFFSLKGRFEGVTPTRQFKSPPAEGAMLEVVVTGFKEDEGLYEVSIPGASVSVADWADLTEGAIVETRITGSNTGGLECTVNNIRGFIPASQIDVVRVENFGDFVNRKMQCVVTEVNPRRKKLVLSHRAILERERQEKKKELMQTLAAGQTLDGIVTKLMDFGAFVDIGGVEGLVHVSKLSWERVEHPSEVLEAGQKVSVKVEKVNPESGKISLSYRDTQENPWTRIDQKYAVGAVVDGTVSRLAQFGAFVKLEAGVEGLVHISELAHHRVIAVKNVVNQGDQVQVKVLSVDPSAQKIGLSLKATLAKPQKSTDASKTDESNEPLREVAVKKREEPLKGGRDKGSGGEQFGLNW